MPGRTLNTKRTLMSLSRSPGPASFLLFLPLSVACSQGSEISMEAVAAAARSSSSAGSAGSVAQVASGSGMAGSAGFNSRLARPARVSGGIVRLQRLWGVRLHQHFGRFGRWRRRRWRWHGWRRWQLGCREERWMRQGLYADLRLGSRRRSNAAPGSGNTEGFGEEAT